ncbi:unnamed protein product, partial [Didymodactylos carnosus]
ATTPLTSYGTPQQTSSVAGSSPHDQPTTAVTQLTSGISTLPGTTTPCQEMQIMTDISILSRIQVQPVDIP